MPALLRPFVVLVRAVRAFFRADLRLQRGKRGLEVVLDESAPAPASGKRRKLARADADALKAQQELQAMQRSLAALLDEMPENRATLRHLAFIEYALARKGGRALAKVPYDVLQRALEQFEGVVTNWSDEGLATLRSKMAVTLIEREAEPAEAAEPAAAQRATTAMAPPSVLDVADLAHPVTLAGEEAEAAEAALRAAYGAVMVPDLHLVPKDDEVEASAVEVQGELASPSARAISRAIRRGDEAPAPAAASEMQV
ncbi:MAG: hypothetical protein AMXMBFR78_08730 [Rubrivivax sp.]|jgi:hypothetical protein|nr:hypothetical protein [Rubrivivax sp.]